MKRRLQIAVLLAGSALVACAHVPQTHYYIFDYSLEHATQSSKSPYILGLANMVMDTPYDQDRLVYRRTDNEVEFYHYHRWVVPPQELIWQCLYRDLRESGLFADVVRYPGLTDADLILTTHIFRLEERDEGDAWFACLELQVALHDAQGEATLQRITFDEHIPLEDKSPLGVVKALNGALQSCSASIIESLKDLFE